MISYQASLLVNILRNFSKPSLEIRVKLSILSSSLRMNQTQLIWHQSWLKLDPICIPHGKSEYSFWICDDLPNSVSRWGLFFLRLCLQRISLQFVSRADWLPLRARDVASTDCMFCHVPFVSSLYVYLPKTPSSVE